MVKTQSNVVLRGCAFVMAPASTQSDVQEVGASISLNPIIIVWKVNLMVSKLSSSKGIAVEKFSTVTTSSTRVLQSTSIRSGKRFFEVGSPVDNSKHSLAC